MVGGGKDREEMSDLISRSSLINKIRGIVPGSQDVDFIIGLIENQPTAFDTEKVVEQLEERKGNVFIDGKKMYQEDYFIDIDDAIDIVKKGGVERDTDNGRRTTKRNTVAIRRWK